METACGAQSVQRVVKWPQIEMVNCFLVQQNVFESPYPMDEAAKTLLWTLLGSIARAVGMLPMGRLLGLSIGVF